MPSRVSVHESGHCIVAIKAGMEPLWLTICADGDLSGYITFREPRGIHARLARAAEGGAILSQADKDHAVSMAVVAMGGPCAEAYLFGNQMGDGSDVIDLEIYRRALKGILPLDLVQEVAEKLVARYADAILAVAEELEIRHGLDGWRAAAIAKEFMIE